jgi:alpha/beta superfamily hydrolase
MGNCMITTLTKNETTQLIKGPAGELEMIVGKQNEPGKGWGIVCHPHSLYGGTMHNKVVTTLVKTFQDLGLNTIRFNFRGVGRSEGHFDQGNGELDDLVAILNWVQEQHRQYDIWLAGFSFGAYVAARAATTIPITKLVTISPPVQHFPMQSLPSITCPWVLAQGEQDEVVSSEAVIEWAESRNPPPIILRFPEASHFFHGQLMELRTRLQEVLRDRA